MTKGLANLQVGIAASLALALAGCQSRTNLVPAPEAERLPDSERVASARSQGVALRVDTGAWTGQSGVKDYVTPLMVEIENGSDRALRVRYSDFALVEEELGGRYAALPPYSIDGTVTERARARFDRPISAVGFRHSRFSVSPFYDGVYPEMRYWRRPFFYEPDYYNHYYEYWRSTPLPTEEMLRSVLPEGVIDPGGSLSGFIYLEKVPQDVSEVEFRYELTDADGGERFGAVTIPFLVNGD